MDHRTTVCKSLEACPSWTSLVPPQIGVSLVSVCAPHQCVPHGRVSHRRACHGYVHHTCVYPHGACTSQACISWVCTPETCISQACPLFCVGPTAMHLASALGTIQYTSWACP